MGKHRLARCPAMVAALLLGLGGAVAAAPDLPLRYFNPVLDGKPAVAGDPTDGTTWAAWAYRAQGEFDLAISSRDASGTWAAPRFLGEGDRLDQVDPALVADGTGNLYLAFAVRPLGRVYLAVRPAGSSEFSNPVEASLPGERASSPQLRIVRDRLVLGYRVGTRVVLRDLPLLGMGTHGVQDGPDILPPLGNTTTPGTGGGGGGGSRSPGSSPAPGS